MEVGVGQDELGELLVVGIGGGRLEYGSIASRTASRSGLRAARSARITSVTTHASSSSAWCRRRGGSRASRCARGLAGSRWPTIGPPPGPRRMVMRPCTSSSRRPSRRLSRDSPNSSSITASDGSLSPVRRPLFTMSRTRSRAKASAVFSGRYSASPPVEMGSARPSAGADTDRQCDRVERSNRHRSRRQHARWPPSEGSGAGRRI